MINKIKTRLASEEGFTLIELLVVIIILGILVAIAVPAYLSFRGTAQDAAAKSNVRSAIPAAEEYYQTDAAVSTFKAAGNPDTYTGLVGDALRFEAPGVGVNVHAVDLNGGQGYCIDDTESNGTFYYIGGEPGTVTGTVGQVSSGDCATNAGATAVAS